MRDLESNMFIELIDVFGFEGAMFGMRNPLNSWYRGDSQWVLEPDGRIPHFEIGANDLDLAKRLLYSWIIVLHRQFAQYLINIFFNFNSVVLVCSKLL